MGKQELDRRQIVLDRCSESGLCVSKIRCTHTGASNTCRWSLSKERRGHKAETKQADVYSEGKKKLNVIMVHFPVPAKETLAVWKWLFTCYIVFCKGWVCYFNVNVVDKHGRKMKKTKWVGLYLCCFFYFKRLFNTMYIKYIFNHVFIYHHQWAGHYNNTATITWYILLKAVWSCRLKMSTFNTCINITVNVGSDFYWKVHLLSK